MKRFAVLFGLIAISIAVVTTTSYATAPSVRDLPDLRLSTGGGKGEVSSGLVDTLPGAYDVFDSVKDIDNAPTDLTVSILGITDTKGTPNPMIQVEGGSSSSGSSTAIVDVFAGASAGWTQYTVKVDDAETGGKGVVNAAVWDNMDTALAKYSTFSLDGPAIDSGRFFDPVVDENTQMFTVVLMGGEAVTPQIPTTPATAVDMSIYINSVVVNDASANYDLNLNHMGKVTELLAQADQGEVVNEGGYGWLINSQGKLFISSSGGLTAGPWLVGIMATNQSDPNDIDTTRIMVTPSMLALAAGGHVPTHDGGETFDTLPTGQIPAAVNIETNLANGGWRLVGGYQAGISDIQEPIGPGSQWLYNVMAGTDTFVNAVPLEVVSVAGVDGPEAGVVPGVGEGKCLMAVMDGAAQTPNLDNNLRNDGFRLQSYLFGGIEYGSVYTFAMNIATNAAGPADLPNYQVFVASADSGRVCGYHVALPTQSLLDLLGLDTPQLPIPLEDQGWGTISVNYSPAAEPRFSDNNLDGQFDEADLQLNFDRDIVYRGGTDIDPTKYAYVGIRVWTRPDMADCTVWLDNFRFFKSEYELDLANGAEALDAEYTEADLDTLYTSGILQTFTGPFDGTIESYVSDPVADLHAELLDIGLAWLPYDGVSRNQGVPGGSLASKKKLQVYDSSISVSRGAGRDHTRNAGSETSLRLVLNGPGAESTTEQQMWYGEVSTLPFDCTIEGAPADGVYQFVTYFAAEPPFNQASTSRRLPQVRLIISELLPNPLGNGAGVINDMGALPKDPSAEPTIVWERQIATLYSPDAKSIRGIIQVQEAPGMVGNPVQVSWFNVPIFIDDMRLYRAADNLDQWDAELFGTP